MTKRRASLSIYVKPETERELRLTARDYDTFVTRLVAGMIERSLRRLRKRKAKETRREAA